MNAITIKLTIGNETREVEAFVSKLPSFTEVTVPGLKLTTVAGNKVHTGCATFIENETNEYNIKGARGFRYSGMRGNGHAVKSKFRNVAF